MLSLLFEGVVAPEVGVDASGAAVPPPLLGVCSGVWMVTFFGSLSAEEEEDMSADRPIWSKRRRC